MELVTSGCRRNLKLFAVGICFSVRGIKLGVFDVALRGCSYNGLKKSALENYLVSFVKVLLALAPNPKWGGCLFHAPLSV